MQQTYTHRVLPTADIASRVGMVIVIFPIYCRPPGVSSGEHADSKRHQKTAGSAGEMHAFE